MLHSQPSHAPELDIQDFRTTLTRCGLIHERYSDDELRELHADLVHLVKLFIEIGPSPRN